MALVYALLASLLIAFCQLCIRSNTQEIGKGEILGSIRFLVSAVICLFCFPVMQNNYSLSNHTLLLAIMAGILQGLLMLYTGKLLSLGSTNISIAILNGASVIPPIVFAFLFGERFNFSYSLFNAVGGVCVVLGFVYGARRFAVVNQGGAVVFSPPIKNLSLALFFQIAFLLFLQWKALNFKPNLPASPFLPFQGVKEGAWFNVIMFFTCGLFLFFRSPTYKVRLNFQEITLFGLIGGLANGFSGILLLIGIDKAANSFENLLLYPILSIGTIFFCQIWGRWLFQENFHWKANLLFLLGILFSCL